MFLYTYIHPGAEGTEENFTCIKVTAFGPPEPVSGEGPGRVEAAVAEGPGQTCAPHSQKT